MDLGVWSRKGCNARNKTLVARPRIVGVGSVLSINQDHSYSLRVWASLPLVFPLPRSSQNLFAVPVTSRQITTIDLCSSPQCSHSWALASINSFNLKENYRQLEYIQFAYFTYLQRNMGNGFSVFQFLQYQKACERRQDWMLTDNWTY